MNRTSRCLFVAFNCRGTQRRRAVAHLHVVNARRSRLPQSENRLEPAPHFSSQGKPRRRSYSVFGVGRCHVGNHPFASSATGSEPDHHGAFGSIAADRVGGTVVPNDRRKTPALRPGCRSGGGAASDIDSAGLEDSGSLSAPKSGGRTPPCSVKCRRKSLIINESYPQSIELGLISLLQWVHGPKTVVIALAAFMIAEVKSLQWVHGPKTVVILGSLVTPGYLFVASMGPRSE